MAVTAAQAATAYVEFTADLFPAQATLPTDLTLRVYADGMPAPSGESFLVDNIEIFPRPTRCRTRRWCALVDRDAGKLRRRHWIHERR